MILLSGLPSSGGEPIILPYLASRPGVCGVVSLARGELSVAPPRWMGNAGEECGLGRLRCLKLSSGEGGASGLPFEESPPCERGLRTSRLESPRIEGVAALKGLGLFAFRRARATALSFFFPSCSGSASVRKAMRESYPVVEILCPPLRHQLSFKLPEEISAW